MVARSKRMEVAMTMKFIRIAQHLRRMEVAIVKAKA
jgi:hypothetical protein